MTLPFNDQYTHLMALCLGLPKWVGTGKVKQEAQLLLGMADRTGLVVKLSYLRDLVWHPSWELDNCPDWLSWSFIDWLPIVRQHHSSMVNTLPRHASCYKQCLPTHVWHEPRQF